ncbi:MAG: 2-phospho-L-lactate transferase [Bauldia litoralis]|uniref:2-phospho-L-lactate transferase n=1 Tax=Bauldia litoralis TaxID=665467 RepID=UPI003296CC7F
MSKSEIPGKVVAICGGVGGAKLAPGLYRVLAPEQLTVVVNTGDDFEHLGLHVSPDIDTVVYTLADLADRERGWGRANETWAFMAALKALGGEDWFNLGDADLAMHVQRTLRLKAGETLTTITSDLARRLGIAAEILPMSDERVRTFVETDEGVLGFQRYFVGRRCEPRVERIRFDGAETARPGPRVLAALADPGVRAVVICPSNPFLSVDPILAVPGMRAAIRSTSAPVVAVTPIIGGQAVKGPTAKIMAELDVPVTALAVASHYDGLIDGFVLDDRDAADKAAFPVAADVVPTLMQSLADREALARSVLAFAGRLEPRT